LTFLCSVRHTIVALAGVIALGIANLSVAQTVAYWRFENGPAGANVIHTGPNGYNYNPDVADSSGNGNALAIWSAGGGTGFAYRSSVPGSPIPETGFANNFSVQNTGGFPASYTGPGTMRTIEPAAFTIEASYKPETGGFRTVVGRDSLGAATSDTNIAALYFGAVPGDAVAIKFVDKAGFFHVAQSANGVIQGFNLGTDPQGLTGRWYNIAAVSDGSTLKLYLDDVTTATGYQLVAQTNLSLSVSSNTALTKGLGGNSTWTAGDWTVGRGMYAGNHVDRAFGFIDEVRISNEALDVSEFLFSQQPDLSLLVNTLNGDVSIRNNTATSYAFDYYQIESDTDMSLVTANFHGTTGWDSLSDRNLNPVDGPDLDSTPGSSPGETWDESAGVSSKVLAELFQLGQTSIAPGAMLSLGRPFNFSVAGSGMEGDLEFFFSQKGDPQLSIGDVEYITNSVGVPGDYSGNGVVDAADYAIWRDNLGLVEGATPSQGDGTGDGNVTSADYDYWRARFGNTSGSGSGSGTAQYAVPEPTGGLLVCGICVATFARIRNEYCVG
jgi:hypothetical protein